MRLVIDSLIACMLVGILAAVLHYHRQQEQQLQRYREVQRALAQLHDQAVFRGALGEGEANTQGYPKVILPTWFDANRLPINSFVQSVNPWLDLAPPNDLGEHPPDPVVTRGDQASFWYNPHRGIFRARVPVQFTERETLELYNRVNGIALLSLPRDASEDRKPEPLQIVTAEVLEAAGQSDAANKPANVASPAAPDSQAKPAKQIPLHERPRL